MDWIPVAEPTEQKIELQFRVEIDHPSIDWTENYEFDGSLPSA